VDHHPVFHRDSGDSDESVGVQSADRPPHLAGTRPDPPSAEDVVLTQLRVRVGQPQQQDRCQRPVELLLLRVPAIRCRHRESVQQHNQQDQVAHTQLSHAGGCTHLHHASLGDHSSQHHSECKHHHHDR